MGSDAQLTSWGRSCLSSS